MRHSDWISYCFKIVNKNKSKKSKHVSVLVKSGRVISVGFNRYDRYGFAKSPHYDPIRDTWHSELDAVYKYSASELRDAILYTVGVNGKNGHILHGCPCNSCRKLLKEYNLKGIYYADKSGKPCRLVL